LEIGEDTLLKYNYLPVFLIVFAVTHMIPYLSLKTYIISGDEFLTTLVISIFGLIYAFASIPAGILHDHLRREYSINMASLTVIIFSSILYLSGDPILYIIGRGLTGLFESIIFVGFIGSIIRFRGSVKGATKSMGRMFASISLAILTAPALSSILISIGLDIVVVYIYFILLLIALVIMFTGRWIEDLKGETHIAGDGKWGGGLIILFVGILMVLIVGGTDGVIQSRSTIWVIDLKLASEAIGIIISTFYVAAILSQLFLPYISERYSISSALSINILVAVLGVILIYLRFTLYPVIYFILIFITGIGVGLIGPYGTSILGRLSRRNIYLGPGIANSVWSIGYFILPTVMATLGLKYILDIMVIIGMHLSIFITTLILVIIGGLR